MEQPIGQIIDEIPITFLHFINRVPDIMNIIFFVLIASCLHALDRCLHVVWHGVSILWYVCVREKARACTWRKRGSQSNNNHRSSTTSCSDDNKTNVKAKVLPPSGNRLSLALQMKKRLPELAAFNSLYSSPTFEWTILFPRIISFLSFDPGVHANGILKTSEANWNGNAELLNHSWNSVPQIPAPCGVWCWRPEKNRDISKGRKESLFCDGNFPIHHSHSPI